MQEIHRSQLVSGQPTRKRVQSFRKRMREGGFVQKSVYVHVEDWERVKRYLDRLRKKRLTQTDRD